MRSGVITSCAEAPSTAAMRSSDFIASSWPSAKSATSLSDGRATYSVVAARMISKPVLRSRLASATWV